MNKYLCILLMVFAVSSCEEAEAPLRFSVMANTNTEAISFDYYSPDPISLPKSYHIQTNASAGRLVIECTNSNNICVDGYDTDNTIIFEEANFTLDVKDNIMSFNFNKTNPDKTEISYQSLTVYVPENKHKTITEISIIRFPR